ncbi:MAG: hypothetical protein JXP34_03075 [Planctomycetes bacterium]|nr:hypothetical protein [Planctomycetota bacterium]
MPAADPAYGPSPVVLRLCFAAGVLLMGGGIATIALGIEPLAFLGCFCGFDLILFSLGGSRVWLEERAVWYMPLFGTYRIPWRDVSCVRIPERGERSGGDFELIVLGGASIGFQVPEDEVGTTADRIARRCTGAFIEDHRTGEISLPREGSANEVRRTARALLEHARRSPWLKPFLSVPAIVYFGSLAAACAVLAAYGITSGEPTLIYSGLVLLVVLLTLVWMGCRSPGARSMARRRVRMYEDLIAGEERAGSAAARPGGGGEGLP